MPHLDSERHPASMFGHLTAYRQCGGCCFMRHTCFFRWGLCKEMTSFNNFLSQSCHSTILLPFWIGNQLSSAQLCSARFADLLQVGSQVLGYGSQGTVVYEGSLHGRPVAVKRMLRHLYHLAKKEIDALILSDEVGDPTAHACCTSCPCCIGSWNCNELCSM